MQIEYLLYPYLINNLDKLSTGLKYFDIFLILIISIFYFFSNNRIIKYKIKNYISKYFSNVKSKIIFKNEEKNRSKSFKALIHFLKEKKYKGISEIKERAVYSWNRDDELEENSRVSGFDISQIEEFQFTDNIKGKVSLEVKEKTKHRDNTEYKDIYTLEIYSEKLELFELEKWVQDQKDIYDKFIRNKCCKDQLLLTIRWDSEDDTYNIDYSEWESSVTFENSYFHNKSKILKKINFFLNNKEWYYERGIPYNLGILLYGEPGGGKTRWIKQLVNYTKRHAIDIKLTDAFDFDSLKKIIHNEKILDEFIIPQDKRIIIFEDIDAVGDILKDRELKKKDNEQKIIKMVENKKEGGKSEPKIINVNNNNLSNFLNIIDGLNECSGRIIIMTTNKIEYLDPAIIRPGRIDIKINFEKCSIDDIFQMLKLFWKKDFKYSKSNLKKELNKKYTSAEIINIFRNGNNFNEIKNFFIK